MTSNLAGEFNNKLGIEFIDEELWRVL